MRSDDIKQGLPSLLLDEFESISDSTEFAEMLQLLSEKPGYALGVFLEAHLGHGVVAHQCLAAWVEGEFQRPAEGAASDDWQDDVDNDPVRLLNNYVDPKEHRQISQTFAHRLADIFDGIQSTSEDFWYPETSVPPTLGTCQRL